jgi:tetratricopeptide (TPR) repeat protein
VEAIGLLESATTRDPRFAGAWSLLALGYDLAADIDWQNAATWIPKAKAAAGNAVRVNQEQADAYSVLGGIALYTEWDFAAAERHLKRAVDLNPGEDHYLRDYADLLRITGRSEQARVEVDRALAIQLNAPRTLFQRALLLYDLDRCTQSDADADRALRLLPGYSQAIWLKGLCAEARGDFSQAEQLFRQVLAVAPQDSRALPALGHTLARMPGRRAEALEIRGQLEELRRQGKRVEYALALVHTGLDNIPAALYWLEQAFATRDVSIIYMNVERRLRPLHGEPRFQDLLRQLHLRK